MSEINEKTISDLVNLGRLGSEVKTVAGGNVPFVVVPKNAKVVPLPEMIYNEHAARPERIRASVNVLDPESFIEYYQLFSDENSRVFAFEPEISVFCVLDYHGAKEGGPRWGQHRLTLTLRKSEEWSRWTGSNNKHFSQVEFAEFLEQNSTDITRPDPASIREIASDLQATTQVEFGSGQRMQDGQVKFKYTETLKATVGSGEVAVPEQFTITIPAFVGGLRVDMQALLRFRVKEGKLVFWYTLVRPEEVIRMAFTAARIQIASTLGVTIINGKPAAQ